MGGNGRLSVPERRCDFPLHRGICDALLATE